MNSLSFSPNKFISNGTLWSLMTIFTYW